MVNLISNLNNSLSGFRVALADRSFKAEVVLGMVLIPATVLSSAASGMKLTIIGTYLLLLAFELVNTSLEKLCDLITLEHNETIKAVKDMASGAVFLVLIILVGELAIALSSLPEF